MTRLERKFYEARDAICAANYVTGNSAARYLHRIYAEILLDSYFNEIEAALDPDLRLLTRMT